jgi:hypothetical protein
MEKSKSSVQIGLPNNSKSSLMFSDNPIKSTRLVNSSEARIVAQKAD